MDYFTFRNGLQMPVLGLGTSNIKPEFAEDAVCSAIQCGYRHIDTASSYLNEKAVGRGIAKSGISRDKLFITVKVWPSDYPRAEQAVEGSFRRLGIDYADILLVHHPVGDVFGCWQTFEKLLKEGKTKALGLSNFSMEQIREFMDRFEIKPSLVTVESHPYASQKQLRSFLNENGIVMEAWYPLGHGDQKLTEEPVFKKLAEKYGKSVVQIILRWHVQIGNSVLPGSKNPDHIRQNLDIFDFRLSDEDMAEIALLDTETLYKVFTDEMRQRYLRWEPDWDDQL